MKSELLINLRRVYAETFTRAWAYSFWRNAAVIVVTLVASAAAMAAPVVLGRGVSEASKASAASLPALLTGVGALYAACTFAFGTVAVFSTAGLWAGLVFLMVMLAFVAASAPVIAIHQRRTTKLW